LAVVAGGAIALVLALVGVLSGQGPTVAQPAAAAVLRGAADALAHPPGSIVIESYRSVQVTNLSLVQFGPGAKQRHGVQVGRWSQREITQTPVGNGPQNAVNLGGPSVTNGVQSGEVNGNNELYDPANNTVYISSDYGSDIRAGATPGTFVFTLPKVQWAPPRSAAGQLNSHLPPPLTITAAQARALRNGTAQVQTVSSPQHPAKVRLRITAAFRVPSETAEIQAQLRAGKLKVVGPITIDGRKAIKLAAIHGIDEYDVAPGTYYPIRQVLSYGRAIKVTTTYSEYRVLPATLANQRLLSLAARHPGARVDDSPADYRAAQARLITGS
jgi:hypothetical protein